MEFFSGIHRIFPSICQGLCDQPIRSIRLLVWDRMAEKLLTRLPNTSYGKDCLYERLLKSEGKICGIGVGLAEAPFLHYVEEIVGVPFRYKKLFTGCIGQNGQTKQTGMDFERAHPDRKWSSRWNSSGKDSSIRGAMLCG